MYWILVPLVFGSVLYYYRKYLLQKLISKLLTHVISTTVNTPMALPAVGFTQLTNYCGYITYMRFGKEYHLYVPYNIPQVLKMQYMSARAIRRDEVIDITTQPGVPYLVSANDLQAEKLEFTSEDGEVKTYVGDAIPYYPEFQ